MPVLDNGRTGTEALSLSLLMGGGGLSFNFSVDGGCEGTRLAKAEPRPDGAGEDEENLRSRSSRDGNFSSAVSSPWGVLVEEGALVCDVVRHESACLEEVDGAGECALGGRYIVLLVPKPADALAALRY